MYLGEALARVLPKLPEIGELLASGNRFSDDALKPLLDACIKIGPKLKTLDLSANDLDDSSAKKLADVLSHEKCGIVSLGIGGRGLGRCGTSADPRPMC